MSSMSIGSDRLRQVNPSNRVRLNAQTAAQLGIESGDRVRVSTPDGSVIGVAECVAGVQADAIAIEHGFGHKELGAREHWIDGQKVVANPLRGAGVNLNDLAVLDPSRHGRYPWWTGPSARRRARGCRPGWRSWYDDPMKTGPVGPVAYLLCVTVTV